MWQLSDEVILRFFKCVFSHQLEAFGLEFIRDKFNLHFSQKTLHYQNYHQDLRVAWKNQRNLSLLRFSRFGGREDFRCQCNLGSVHE
jgi:hypothetical protein